MIRCLVLIALVLRWCVEAAAAQALISIDARDTDLSDVIRLIGLQSGLNIVTDASVKPRRITFRIHGVSTGTALDALAQAYDLQTHRVGTIVLVGDAATMNRRYSDGSRRRAAHRNLRAEPRHAGRRRDRAACDAADRHRGRSRQTFRIGHRNGRGDTIARTRSLVRALDGPETCRYPPRSPSRWPCTTRKPRMR